VKRSLLVASALVSTLLVQARAQVRTPIAPIKIDSGLVAGKVLASGAKAWLGIPYVQAPVRELRWKAPQPIAWEGVYNADRTMPECIQILRPHDINHYFGEEATSEDCLYLNVWAPAAAKAGERLPVLVWIYGGGFNQGSASSPIYAGSELAKKGAIYVALNYRVGVMGFLAHPDMTKESGHNASGNWGFLDQIQALRWVQKNIAAFGGDAANVTLVGQSAGSMSINNLQASPLAKGLFKRVIGMSGSTFRGGAPAQSTLAEAEAQGTRLQDALKAKNLSEMRGFSSDKVVTASQTGGVRAGQIIDGYVLPDSVDNIFHAGKQNDAAVLTGSTARDIGTTVPIRAAKTLAEYKTLASQMYGDKAAELLALYPASNDADAVRQAEEIGRNSGFTVGARAWAREQTRTGKEPAYLYILSRVQPFTPGAAFSDFNPATAGAYHMGDVPYWLGTYEAFNLFRRTRDWTAWDRELSTIMQDVIVAFARTGNPSTRAAQFMRYTTENPTRIDFGDTVKIEKLNTAGMDFLETTPAASAATGRGGRGGRGGSR